MALGMNPYQPYQWYSQPQQAVQPIPQPVQPQNQGPPMVIPGRVVNNPSEIRPNEVPMDGSVSYFPTQDKQYVFAKQWNSDGTISTAKYARCVEPVPQPQEVEPARMLIGDDVSKTILERLDKIEKMLAKGTGKEAQE